MSAQQSDIITKGRNSIRKLREAHDELRNLRKQISAQGGAAALLPQDQFVGDNDMGPTSSADFAAAITSTQTIDDWQTAQFHWDVLFKVV